MAEFPIIDMTTHSSLAHADAQALDDLAVQHDETRLLALKAVKASLENSVQLGTLTTTHLAHEISYDMHVVHMRWHLLGLWTMVGLLSAAVIVLLASR